MPIDLPSARHREDDEPHQRTMGAEREPVEHRVKSWPRLFTSTLCGEKKHELRRISDRDYRVGDFLLLQEFDPATQRYSGRDLRVKITYITSAESPCALSKSALNPEFCILSIEKV